MAKTMSSILNISYPYLLFLLKMSLNHIEYTFIQHMRLLDIGLVGPVKVPDNLKIPTKL